jgi:acetolactate synthase I/II/III large subunit
MKVCDVIVEFCIDKGIDIVFGIIGSANARIYKSFASRGIKIVNVHHEQCAVHAAGAYYKTCGKLAVALVTAGGGVTNAITGIVSLWSDSIPCIIISGQEASKYVEECRDRRMYGMQGVNVTRMTEGIVKYAKVAEAGSIQDDLETMYTHFSPRFGPMLMDVPFDVQSSDVITRPWKSDATLAYPSLVQTSHVYDLFINSERPVVLFGNGVKLSGASGLVEKFMKVPIMLSWSAIDLIGHDTPLYFGIPGIYGQRRANFIIQKCDLLLVIGSRLALPQTGYNLDNFAKNAKIVMVDIDDTEFKSCVDVKIKADCRDFMEAFDIPDVDYSSWIHECDEIKTEFPVIGSCHMIDHGFPNSYRVIDKISEYLTADHVIVTDMGTALVCGHQSIRLKQGAIMFSSYGLGEMGYGLPGSIGASFAARNRQVICLNCDGSMMLNLQELQTIIQHGLNIKIVIFNNDGYLSIKHTQKMLFKGEFNSVNSETGICLPNYINLGKAFGYDTYQIKTLDEMCTEFEKFITKKGPALCEIFMPPEQEFVPKLQGVEKNGIIYPPDFDQMYPPL